MGFVGRGRWRRELCQDVLMHALHAFLGDLVQLGLHLALPLLGDARRDQPHKAHTEMHTRTKDPNQLCSSLVVDKQPDRTKREAQRNAVADAKPSAQQNLKRAVWALQVSPSPSWLVACRSPCARPWNLH